MVSELNIYIGKKPQTLLTLIDKFLCPNAKGTGIRPFQSQWPQVQKYCHFLVILLIDFLQKISISAWDDHHYG